jgi:hypothetical protein
MRRRVAPLVLYKSLLLPGRTVAGILPAAGDRIYETLSIARLA